MTDLLTAAQMRAIEQAAIDSGAVTGLELMERAGQGVVDAVLEEWPELALTSHKAVVLCGPGNNGGDGFVVARLLKARGWDVEVFLYGEAERLPPDARVNYERLGDDISVSGFENLAVLNRKPHLIVDAVFGTGLQRALPTKLAEIFEHLNGFSNRFIDDARVSIDVPSGIDSDSGRPFGEAFEAELTVTFHRGKFGHHLDDGPRCAGRLKVCDLGLESRDWRLPHRALAKLHGLPPNGKGLGKFVVTNFHVDSDLGKCAVEHKYNHGHALILSGPACQSGAARLAARGALRIGAGVVSIAAPPDAMAEHAAQLNAIMLKPVADAGALARILEDWRIKALCIGPGFGTSAREVGMLAAVLGVPAEARQAVRNECAPYGEGADNTTTTDKAVPGLTRDLDPDAQRADPSARAGAAHKRSIVLDADALTLLAKHPTLFAALHENCILTPHAGEFARLFPDIAEKLAAPATKGPAYSKVDATREAAARAGCVVLFKGPDTVIAAPNGQCAINAAHYERAAPWLATAGSGDVLAGFITGLLARGFAPMQAAETAAWLHVECARHFGPGLIAEDIPEQLPAVFRALGVN